MTKRVLRNELDRKYQEGINKHFKGVKSLSIAGREFKPAELDKEFGANADLWDAYEAARAIAHEAYVKALASEKATAPVRSGFRAYVVAVFGDASPKLADFGIKGRKQRRALSSEEKTMAVLKMKATREARHTMGRRKKEKIVGTVSPLPSAGGTPATAGVTNGASSNGAAASPVKAVATA